MVDLQTIEIRDVLKITGVSFVPDADPLTLIVQGQDFNNAFEVFINEALSPDVVISSNTTLLAQVPDSEVDVPIRSIVAVSSRLTRTDRSKIFFRISDSPRSISGFERLIQTFLKIMLQSTKSDIFYPNSGGNLLQSVGKTIGNPVVSTMVSDFHLAVSQARRQILALQVRDPYMDSTERLAFARVINARFVPSELALLGRVHIGNQAGYASTVGLGL